MLLIQCLFSLNFLFIYVFIFTVHLNILKVVKIAEMHDGKGKSFL